MGWLRDFLMGSPEKHDQVSTLLPEQQKLLQQLMSALSGQGAGGAFGDSADYFRNILSDDPEIMNQFFAPEQRKFNEQIIPGLSEQFAGMGAGNLSSSGFRNAAVNAGTDLQERLGAIRANLKQQAAGGLSGLGNMGLGQFSQDRMTQPGSEGFLSTIAPLAAQVASAYVGMPGAYDAARSMSGKGKSSPYGGSTGSGMGSKQPYRGY